MQLSSVYKRFFVAAFAVGFLSARAYCTEYESVNLPRLKPAASFAEAIENDGPLVHVTLANDGALWMLGRHYLWRWYPLTGSLKRIDLGPTVPVQSEPRAIAVHSDGVFLALKGRIWKYAVQTEQIQAYAGTWGDECQRPQIVVSSKIFAVVNTCGAYLIDRSGNRIQKMSAPESLRRLGGVSTLDGCLCFFGTAGKNLIRFDIKGTSISERVLYTAKGKLLGSHPVGDQIAAWTEHALMAFEPASGKRLQVVPTSGLRKIRSAAFAPDLHMIGFDDGVVETLVPSTKKAWTTKVKEMDASAVLLDPAGAFAIFKSPTGPIVLGLEGLSDVEK